MFQLRHVHVPLLNYFKNIKNVYYQSSFKEKSNLLSKIIPNKIAKITKIKKMNIKVTNLTRTEKPQWYN